MKRLINIFALTLSACVCVCAQNQDTVLSRNVTVEREFKPVIQAAGKVNQRPVVAQVETEPAEMHYSDYTSLLSPDFNLSSLLSQPTRFEVGKSPDGYLKLGVGHTSTLLDFRYHLRDGKRATLDVYADHEACWGRKALENTALGLKYKHNFQDFTMYFGVDGGSEFFSRYGRYYDGNKGLTAEHFSEMNTTSIVGGVTTVVDRQNIWWAGGYVGFQSKNSDMVVYDVNLGYKAYNVKNYALENQIRLNAKVAYQQDAHQMGLNFRMQNNFYKLHTLLQDGAGNWRSDDNNPRHFVRMEPFYEYQTKKLQVHVGVNLDIVSGKGQLLSNSENIAFAPSPNFHIEGQVAKWMTVYGKATGKIADGSFQSAIAANRYTTFMPILYSHHVGPYTPVDAEAGFHIRPEKNLLLEVHGGYAYMKNCKTSFATIDTTFVVGDASVGTGLRNGQLDYWYCDQSRWKIGGSLAYHYRDIVDIHVWGDYYFWNVLRNEFGEVYDEANDVMVEQKYFPKSKFPTYSLTNGRVYDRPNWELGARVDGRIDKNWSLFTEFRAVGSRWAMVGDALTFDPAANATAKCWEVQLKPMLDWNLGVQYELPQYNLSFFAEVNNLLCRYNDIYYGIQSEGTNFLLGATWRF